eukprot:CAMPEP_0174337586 /NCGR_PEP_ID=MMETSP0810-20121108/22452_1 /TAXON_ID=73025 ORGANISM="Eutreptiella gymnastica-like, Strain CCMP1594" /NCGR_SAMPLE_ID=MMETSP0810 /ASSEMBLY_ACC=CAM_ASM_000659 /LENGTH=1201 /DNA_ID=CAMNT_0015457155 /DNA_START=38 /DNA_END=3643 /DNA_ORIENTATION=-
MAGFDGVTPRGVYIKHCQQLGCRKNIHLLRSLSDSPDGFNQLTELDLTHNLVGRVGFKAVLEVIQIAYNLRRLCLANNGLDDNCILSLLPAIKGHSELVFLDLSSNPLGRASGKELLQFVKNCPTIQWLLLEETLILHSLHQMIDQKVLENRHRSSGVTPPRYAEAGPSTSSYGRPRESSAPLMLTGPASGAIVGIKPPRPGDVMHGSRVRVLPREARVHRFVPRSTAHDASGNTDNVSRVLMDDRRWQRIARQNFQEADVHHIGSLSTIEVGLVMHHTIIQIGLPPPHSQEVAVVLDLLDSNKCGRLTEDEFVHAVRGYLMRQQKTVHVQQPLDAFTDELLREPEAPFGSSSPLYPPSNVSRTYESARSGHDEVGIDDLDQFGTHGRAPVAPMDALDARRRREEEWYRIETERKRKEEARQREVQERAWKEQARLMEELERQKEEQERKEHEERLQREYQRERQREERRREEERRRYEERQRVEEKLREEERQRLERLREEKAREERLREEKAREERLREEKAREQRRLEEERLREQRLREERAREEKLREERMWEDRKAEAERRQRQREIEAKLLQERLVEQQRLEQIRREKEEAERKEKEEAAAHAQRKREMEILEMERLMTLRYKEEQEKLAAEKRAIERQRQELEALRQQMETKREDEEPVPANKPVQDVVSREGRDVTRGSGLSHLFPANAHLDSLHFLLPAKPADGGMRPAPERREEDTPTIVPTTSVDAAPGLGLEFLAKSEPTVGTHVGYLLPQKDAPAVHFTGSSSAAEPSFLPYLMGQGRQGISHLLGSGAPPVQDCAEGHDGEYTGLNLLMSSEARSNRHVALLLPEDMAASFTQSPSASGTSSPMAGVRHLLSADADAHPYIHCLLPAPTGSRSANAPESPHAPEAHQGLDLLLSSSAGPFPHIQYLMEDTASVAPTDGIGHLIGASDGPCPGLELLREPSSPAAQSPADTDRWGLNYLLSAESKDYPGIHHLLGHAPSVGRGQAQSPSRDSSFPGIGHLLAGDMRAYPALEYLLPESSASATEDALDASYGGIKHLLASPEMATYPHTQLLLPPSQSDSSATRQPLPAPKALSNGKVHSTARFSIAGDAMESPVRASSSQKLRSAGPSAALAERGAPQVEARPTTPLQDPNRDITVIVISSAKKSTNQSSGAACPSAGPLPADIAPKDLARSSLSSYCKWLQYHGKL